MRHCEGRATFIKGGFLLGAWTLVGALMQPTPVSAVAGKRSPVKNLAGQMDGEYVQNMVSSGLSAAVNVMGDATHQRFRKLESDIAEIMTTVQNITGAAQQYQHHDHPHCLYFVYILKKNNVIQTYEIT